MLAAESPGLTEERRHALLDQAIAAFHSMLARDPTLARVRLELARAFFMKKEDGLARQHFEQVLAEDPPKAVQQNINRFLSAIRQRKRWQVNLGISLAPDTNIASASEVRTVYIWGLPFKTGEPVTSGVGVAAWVAGEYRHPISESRNIRLGGGLHVREYGGSQNDFHAIGMHGGLGILQGEDGELGALLTARRSYSGGEPHSLDVGTRLELRRRVTSRLSFSGDLSLGRRTHDTQEHLDGPIADLTLGTRHFLSSTAHADVSIGVGADRPEAINERNRRVKLSLGLSRSFAGGLTATGGIGMQSTRYRGNWHPRVPEGGPREDVAYTVGLGVHHSGLTFGGFSPRISVVREKRESNAPVFEYTKTSGELGFVRQF